MGSHERKIQSHPKVERLNLHFEVCYDRSKHERLRQHMAALAKGKSSEDRGVVKERWGNNLSAR